jgi:hypothetical protein
MSMSKEARTFTFKHPLFRSRIGTNTGVWYEDSIYYFWWRFLRLHEGYRKTCERGGQGPYSKLFADFGDVHTTDVFQRWWSEGNRGAQLFAEPPSPGTVELLTRSRLETLSAGWDEDRYLVIGIPLRLPKAFIQRKVSKLVRQHHQRKRGQRLLGESRAKYPVAGQFSIKALRSILDCYELRHSQPDLPLWAIAQKVGFMKTRLTPEDLRTRGTGEASDKRLSMTSATSRKLKQAKSIIEGVGKGRFPILE